MAQDQSRTPHGVLLRMCAVSAAAAFAGLIQLSPAPAVPPLAEMQRVAVFLFSVGLPVSLGAYVIAMVASGDLMSHLPKTRRLVNTVTDLTAFAGSISTLVGAGAVSLHLLGSSSSLTSPFAWPTWPYWFALALVTAVLVWAEWSGRREGGKARPRI